MEKQNTTLTAKDIEMDEKIPSQNGEYVHQNGENGKQNGVTENRVPAEPKKGQAAVTINPEVEVKTVKKDKQKEKVQHIGFFTLVST